jgi:hypothetical protein
VVNINAKGAAADSQDDEESVCILCRCDFIRGFITQWFVRGSWWLTV